MFLNFFINYLDMLFYKILNVAFIEKQGKGRHSIISLTVFSFRGDLQLLKEEFQILSEDSIWHPFSMADSVWGPRQPWGTQTRSGKRSGEEKWKRREFLSLLKILMLCSPNQNNRWWNPMNVLPFPWHISLTYFGMLISSFTLSLLMI